MWWSVLWPGNLSLGMDAGVGGRGLRVRTSCFGKRHKINRKSKRYVERSFVVAWQFTFLSRNIC